MTEPARSDTPPWRQRWRQLAPRIRLFADEAALDREVFEPWARATGPQVLGFVNAHAMNMASVNAEFFHSLMGCDLLLRDGSGMALHYRLRGQPAGLNLNGTDLIPRIIARFDGAPIALWGTQQPFLDAARDAVAQRLAPRSALPIEHGFHAPEHYVALALAQRPRLVVLGMGMPKQERVALALRAAVDFPCLVVCGGAILDFLGGKVERAPGWLRSAGLEWVYRLAIEPKRMFRRYVLGNPEFLARSLLSRSNDVR